MKRRGRTWWAGVWLACAASAAGAETTVYVPPECPAGTARELDTLLRCFAPVFVAPESEESHNRIGTPEVQLRERWLRGPKAKVVVNPDRPTMFAEVREDHFGARRLLQLVYRIHFEKVPWDFSLHFHEAHRNVGLLVLVSLDAATLEPLFITAVHTCGCYRAVLATEALGLERDARPRELKVYGQTLPAVVPAPRRGRTRVQVYLLADRHRVADVEVDAALPGGVRVAIPLEPIASLRQLTGPDGTRHSFFYTRGPLKGHVRGAWNALEGLTLFGLVALDPTAGMDKDFGDPEETGTGFYTMLRFWKHGASRLDRFDALLRELGFPVDMD